MLEQFNGVTDGEDGEDGEESGGNLEDGMKAWAMTDLVGLPKGGGVATEEYALQAYSEFKAEVRSTAMTAVEAGKDIQHRLSNPSEALDKLEDAKGKMGPKFREAIERDRIMDRRVASTAREQ